MKPGTVFEGAFTQELKSRYLTYAMSTIMSRALPDVRDGLKPVHRRLLYSMKLLRLDPDKAYKKCARVVGDVIGKYHPHGDQAVYEAMVRLAQDFSVRYPLVEGQGNFGSIDGDGAAAMRYTEARLTEVARWIMKDLDQGTVDFKANYDESEQEPIVMPSCFPNLLANGASGIAVGLSTSIPPHNVTELCKAMKVLLKNPESTDAAVMKHVQGPDFPTGGVVVENTETIHKAYATGRGSLRVRARWQTEDMGRGQYQIVVTEVPYQIQKSKLIEKIADLINTKKLTWLTDIRDESEEKVRIVLEPKNRNVDAEALMEALFRMTDMENRFSLNMNVITAEGKTKCLSLKDALLAFLTHRREVLVRKSKWRLAKIAERLHILDAYRVVFLNIDEVIQIIKTEDDPAPVMMERFGIDDIQAEAILNMRLRRLRKLEEMEIKKEYDNLVDEQGTLQDILASEDKQTEVLVEEADAIRKQFGDKRRTSIEDAPDAVVIPLEAQVEKEPTTVLLSKQGWIRTLKGHMNDDDDVRFKEGDEEAFRLHCQSTDSISVMTDAGKVYNIEVNKLPGGRGFGEPLRLMVEMSAERVTALWLNDKDKYLVATEQGQGFIVEGKNLVSHVKTGKQVLNLGKKDKAVFCTPAIGDMVGCISEDGRLLVYPVEDVAVLTRGKGVKLMNLKKSTLRDVCVFAKEVGFGLENDKGTRKSTFEDISIWDGKRAQVGKPLPFGYQQGAKFYTPEGTEDAAEGGGPKSDESAPEKESRVESLVGALKEQNEQAKKQAEEDSPGLFDLLDDE